jgi:hypothetical protein
MAKDIAPARVRGGLEQLASWLLPIELTAQVLRP